MKNLKDSNMKIETYEQALEAVKNNGWAIKHVPQHLITPGLCLEAVKYDGWAIKHIPQHLITPGLCLEAVKNYGWTLEDVPQKFRTPGLCLEAVMNYGRALQFVPKEIKQGNFKTDINDLTSLKAYVRFTLKKKQTEEYIEAFLTKASTQDIDELGDFISLKAIQKYFIPCLICTSNKRLKKFIENTLAFPDNKKIGRQ